jgi:hypothetical protein
MKLAVITGWILLALEGLFVAVLFVSKNMGDDAAGRGMARGFAVILGPILLVAAALFIWGQRGGPRPAFWAGFGIMAIPLVFFLVTSAKKTLRGFDLAAGKALYGKFNDRRLTRLARAIEKNDTATVRSIIAEGPIDFTARSKRGRTILGRAIEHASGAYDAPEAVASVRMLLEAGGKPLPNLIEPEFSQGDLDAHLLVAYVFGGNSPNTLPLLDLVLGAGADPNMRNYEGQPLYFSSYLTLPKLEMLPSTGRLHCAGDHCATTAADGRGRCMRWRSRVRRGALPAGPRGRRRPRGRGRFHVALARRGQDRGGRSRASRASAFERLRAPWRGGRLGSTAC